MRLVQRMYPPGASTTQSPTAAEPPRSSEAPVAPPTQHGRRVALAVLLLLTFLAVAWLASPLLVGLVLGTVMAFTAQPLHRAIARKLGGRNAPAAALATLIGGLLMLIGGAGAVYVIARELIQAIALLQREVSGGSIGSALGERSARLLQALGVNRDVALARMQEALGRIANEAARTAGIVVQATTGALLTLVIALWTMYYVLVEWPRISLRLERLLPLEPRHTRALVLEFREVGRSAFVGTIASAIVQGTLAGIGFAIAGVPQAVTWGAMLAITSFIPVVGTALVWLPVAIERIATGHVGSGIFVIVWSLVLVMAATDYVIRPRLVGSRGSRHPFLMFVAILGGLSVLGLAGLILGPVLMALFVAILRIYEREVKSADT
jgi:predicted PurR-regulated permease PerM